MLRYSVKPNKETFLKAFPIKELYVSPDLSSISGVTDYNYGLVDGEEIVIKSQYLFGDEINTINVSMAKRQGRVKVAIKLFPKSITTALNFPIINDGVDTYVIVYNHKVVADENRKIIINENEIQLPEDSDYIQLSITQKFIEYKGDISYLFSGDTDSTGYLVNNKFYEADKNTESIIINDYIFIEDGELRVGNNVYTVDFTELDGDGNVIKPRLKLNKDSKYVSAENGNLILGYLNGEECTAVTDSNGSVVIYDYDPKKWKRVTKVYITKAANPRIKVDDVMYGGYRHLVTFDDSNYYMIDVFDDESGDYLGYGTRINGFFYPALNNYGNDELYELHHDLQYDGSALYVAETDEYLDIEDVLISQQNNGKFVIMVDTNGNDDISEGNFIIAESENPISIERLVECELDDNKECVNKYITYQGDKYYIEDRLYDTVNISTYDFVLSYLNDDKTSASTVINGDTLLFDVTYNEDEDKYEAKLSYKVYYDGTTEDDAFTQIKYGIKDKQYEVSTASGVTVNGKKYKVIVEKEDLVDDGGEVIHDEIYYEYVTIVENVRFLYEVREVNGSGTYLLYPVVDKETIDEVEEDTIQREINSIVVNNWKTFSYYVRKDTFGVKHFTVENGLMDSMSASTPYTTSDSYLLSKTLQLFRIQDFISFNFPLMSSLPNNLRRDDIINHDFVEYAEKSSTNNIVDMEKDVYYPVWRENPTEFKPVEQIRFNLHFRTRTLGNWKVIEDDREYANDRTNPNCNWFITDNQYYSNTTSKDKLQNASDLLGLLNFSTDEIKYQSTKVGKSFLRLSYYSTPDPKTQILLYTSTIFFDENSAFTKYINSKRNSDLSYVDIINNENLNTITNLTEVYGDIYFNDETRLSSRFVVTNKHMTDTSSEGYYIYMFKEYSKKTRPGEIYLKVDFNHAGIGKTIQFMLPRKDDGTPMYIHKDLDKLKEGFKMQDIYKQTYIPINIVYDEKSNKYVYFLSDAIRENFELDVENEIMEFNLFEVKFANESLINNESN